MSTKPPKVEIIAPDRRNTHIVPTQRTALDQNPAVVYLATLAPGSRRTMEQALNTIALLLGFDDLLQCPWGKLRFQHTTAIRTMLMAQYQHTTANKMLSALRGTMKQAWKLGQLDSESYQRAVDLDAVRGSSPDAAAGRSVDRPELEALLTACANDDSIMGVRDLALIALAYSAGLRRAEFVSLDLKDFDTVKETLTVRGKRNKTRVIPVVGGALVALKQWLEVRGDAPGALFLRIWKGGNLSTQRLTAQAIYHIQAQRAKQGGVEHFSPHDFRRTFAGDLLDAGVDIVTVQKLMGHADTNTTARYDRRGERAKRTAVEKLELPLPKREN
jgi:integrase